jgi:hypothetical protein
MRIVVSFFPIDWDWLWLCNEQFPTIYTGFYLDILGFGTCRAARIDVFNVSEPAASFKAGGQPLAESCLLATLESLELVHIFGKFLWGTVSIQSVHPTDFFQCSCNYAFWL